MNYVLVEKIGKRPVFIGDGGSEELRGAKGLGMHTILLILLLSCILTNKLNRK